MRNTIRCGFIEGIIQFRVLICKPRTLLFLLALVMIMSSYVLPFDLLVAHYEDGISIVESFILTMNTSTYGGLEFFVYLIFLVILNDLPLLSYKVRYRIIRMERSALWIAQIIVAVLFTLLYMIVIILVTVLPFIGEMSIRSEWSRCIYEIATQKWREYIQVENMRLFLPLNFLEEYTPWEAFGLTSMYMSAHLLFSCLFISAFHTFFPKIRPSAISILGVWYLMGWVVYEGIPSWCEYFSIVHISRLRFLNEAYNMHAPSLEYANFAWCVLLIGTIIGLFIATKRFKIENLLEKEG